MAKDVVLEVGRLRKELKKHGAEEKILLDLLDAVGEQDIDRQVLKDTGIGKTVAKLAKDDRSAVAARAKQLLEKLKNLAKAGKGDKKVPTLDRQSSTSSVNMFSATEPDTPSASATNEAPEESGNADAPASKAKLEKVPLPADPKRKRTCDLIQAIFAEDEKSYSKEHIINVSAHIELAMCNEFGASTANYKQKYRQLKSNFNLNKSLKERVLTGNLLGDVLVKMSNEELLSEDKAEANRKYEEEVFNSARQDWLDSKREDMMKAVGINIQGGMYTCSRCGSKKTTHYQKQTRSADEPMTVFVQW
mmetsp:Transcript_9062/g.17021  ORF Transcript_9062/g.17021 Transcript_9062/m.17021 type:complete len:305 (+) Transcript_9062:26-940(+)